MLVDGRRVPEGTIFKTDLCIVGGGTTAIVLAGELASSSFRVSLLGRSSRTPHGHGDPRNAESIGRHLLKSRNPPIQFAEGLLRFEGVWRLKDGIHNDVSAYLYSTLVNIESDNASSGIRLQAASLEGNTFSIAARYFILAGGRGPNE